MGFFFEKVWKKSHFHNKISHTGHLIILKMYQLNFLSKLVPIDYKNDWCHLLLMKTWWELFFYRLVKLVQKYWDYCKNIKTYLFDSSKYALYLFRRSKRTFWEPNQNPSSNRSRVTSKILCSYVFLLKKGKKPQKSR